MVLLTEFFLKLDYFGRPVELVFNSKSTIPSLIGCLLTIILYGLLIGLMISQFSEFIMKEKTKSNVVNKYITKAPDLFFEDDQIIIAFGALNQKFQVINDSSIINYSVVNYQQTKVNNTNTVIRVPVPMVKCSTYLPIFKLKGLEQAYKDSNLNNNFCFNTSNLNWAKLRIGGAFDADHLSILQVFVNKCTNTTNIVCKTEKEIESTISRGFFNFYFMNTYVDTQKYKVPLQRIFDQYNTRIDPNSSKITNFFFKQVNVSSDEGVIFESYSNQYSYMTDFYNEQSTPDVIDREIYRLTINSSNTSQIHYRYYIKIQDICANIGGFMKLFINYR